MKILIDINHPAHVHYFRNFIKLMEAKEHRFCVINRNSMMINQLLDYYGIEHTIRNKRPPFKSSLFSIFNLIWMTLWCIRKSLSFRPDLYMGFGSSVCAITSSLFRKPCILLDDTEHNNVNHRIYMPRVSLVLTPFYFTKDLNSMGKGNKQIRFNGYVEQLYLHSQDYTPSLDVLKELKVNPKEYVIVRFSGYDAHHDLTLKHLTPSEKMYIIKEIATQYRVFLSSEEENAPDEYKEYQLHISPEKMHDLMAYAKFIVTEGATMASEAFVLGIPYVFIGSSLPAGNIDYQCHNYPNVAHRTINGQTALSYVKRLMMENSNYFLSRELIESQTIRPTKYLIEFIEKFQYE